MCERIRYRSIWLSDFHLGTRDCKVDFLLDFLANHEADYLYLVGDIVDGWALRRSWYWTPRDNDVLQALLHIARQGTHVVYIPGNHDAFARHFLHLTLGDIVVRPNALHATADGRDLLVLHGDEFDGVVKLAPWLSWFGAWAYRVALRLNGWYNRYRRRFGKPYWSLSAYLKQRAKRAAQYIDRFEETVAREARVWEVDGVVCGHIHHAEMREIGGVLYANTGDWVESCTALVEHLDGRLELLRWIPSGHGMQEAIATEAPFSRDGQKIPAEALDADGSSA